MTHSNEQSFSRRNWLGLISTASVGAGLLAQKALGADSSVNSTADNKDLGVRTSNIRDFVAKGDGSTLDPAGGQAGIGACTKDQGGTVLVPPRAFGVGRGEIKSNVPLHSAAQAKLLG